MYKCDRCGRVFGDKYAAYGTAQFYSGSVTSYEYSDQPKINKLDLCGECQAELDFKVRRFMGGSDA